MIQVVDASVVVDMLVDDGPSGRWCEDRVLEASMAAPYLMQYEAANLIRRSAARGLVDGWVADWALRRLTWFQIDLLPFDLVAPRAWDLRDTLTFYDACYVAAAERLEARFLTLDRKLAAAPGLKCDVLTGPGA